MKGKKERKKDTEFGWLANGTKKFSSFQRQDQMPARQCTDKCVYCFLGSGGNPTQSELANGRLKVKKTF